MLDQLVDFGARAVIRAADLATLLPHTRIEVLEGIGHTPQIECPDVVANAIQELAR